MCHKCLSGEIAQIKWSSVDHNLKLLLNLDRDCKVFFDQKIKLFHIKAQNKNNNWYLTIMNGSHICVPS